MHHEFYQLFLHSIFAAFKDIASDQSLEVVLNYIEINRVQAIAFDMFGLHVLQLLGIKVRQLNESMLMQLLRKVYFSISIMDRDGRLSLKELAQIRPIDISDLPALQLFLQNKVVEALPSPAHSMQNSVENPLTAKHIAASNEHLPLNTLPLSQDIGALNSHSPLENSRNRKTVNQHLKTSLAVQEQFEPYNRRVKRPHSMTGHAHLPTNQAVENSIKYEEAKQIRFVLPKLQTMKGRFDIKRRAIEENKKIQKDLNNSFSICYPPEEKMRNKYRANISSFMLGGYDIIDYSDAINKLHKKLLKKIVLNR